MPTDCIFCRIVANQAPSQQVYHDEEVTAFRDAHPVAPVHILIVPNRHITSTNDLRSADEALMGHMLVVAAQLAEREGVYESGYRLIVNTGPDAGQAVFHVHLHLMGGHRMRYPMG